MARQRVPNPTPIYHITHVDNLAGIIANECLYCDARRRAGECNPVRIGYEHIKDRRMNRPVLVAARGSLGNYVPFNFCPRSVMLHSIWRGNVPGYDGGQERVLHLVSSVPAATQVGQPWAFTDRHAEVADAEYSVNVNELAGLRWDIVQSDTWGGDERRPFKQAEFLVHDSFPWSAIEAIGVMNRRVAGEVEAVLEASECDHQPLVRVKRSWYYL